MTNAIAGFTASLLLLLLSTATSAQAADRLVLLASTIGPIDAGIVPLLEDRFEQETGIRVRHVGAGTGEALKLAESGTFDLVLVHAKSLEDKFVKDGFGTERIPLMYNDFIVVGPATDPAGVKRARSAAEALSKIAGAKALFVSRGDRSGTNVAELSLWDRAGVKPSGTWYVVYEKGNLGNAPTLEYADQRGAYTVMDRATWLSFKGKLNLALLFEKDEALLNYISLIPVDPRKFPRVNHDDAMTFVKWLTSPEHGQKIVEDFGRDKYGAALFFPNSREWVAQKRSR
jgi:tungstate transport system substrate-binding protein